MGEQNTKFRQAVMQMRKGTIRGFWNRMRQPNPNPPNGNATNKAEAQVASNPNKRNENQSALKSDKSLFRKIDFSSQAENKTAEALKDIKSKISAPFIKSSPKTPEHGK